MPITLAPYISFAGNAREAITFYGEVFGGTPEIATFGHFNALPEDHPNTDNVMHGALDADPVHLYVSDYIEGMGQRTEGNNVTLALMGDDETIMQSWWNALAADGSVVMPLEKQIWGDVYGALTDKFGIEWQFNISSGR